MLNIRNKIKNRNAILMVKETIISILKFVQITKKYYKIVK